MILWRIRNKIGCKSETKKGDDYASAGGGVFCVFVFLWKKDRELLMGQRRMTFVEFERLVYLTDFLGFDSYSFKLWNQYAQEFERKLQEVQSREMDGEENSVWVSEFFREREEDRQQKWIEEFFGNVPDKRGRQQLGEILEERHPGIAL